MGGGLTEAVGVKLSASAHGATPTDRTDSSSAVQEAAAQGIAGGSGPLPHAETIQRLFGRHDISGIEAHVGGPAATASRTIGAEAYAYSPGEPPRIAAFDAFASPGWVQILCVGGKLIDFARLVRNRCPDRSPAGSVSGLMSTARATTIANDSPFCESRQYMKKLEDGRRASSSR